MNNPSREEFNELKEEVRKLRLQYSEPITIPRIELDPGGIQSRLDNHAVILEDISKKQDEQEQQLTLIYTDVGHMKTDIGQLKSSVMKLESRMERVEQKVDEGFQSMEKRFDAMAEVYKLILERLPKPE
jgi:septal ring factor EnvC (AmiA/AmiB activator)